MFTIQSVVACSCRLAQSGPKEALSPDPHPLLSRFDGSRCRSESPAAKSSRSLGAEGVGGREKDAEQWCSSTSTGGYPRRCGLMCTWSLRTHGCQSRHRSLCHIAVHLLRSSSSASPQCGPLNRLSSHLLQFWHQSGQTTKVALREGEDFAIQVWLGYRKDFSKSAAAPLAPSAESRSVLMCQTRHLLNGLLREHDQGRQPGLQCCGFLTTLHRLKCFGQQLCWASTILLAHISFQHGASSLHLDLHALSQPRCNSNELENKSQKRLSQHGYRLFSRQHNDNFSGSRRESCLPL